MPVVAPRSSAFWPRCEIRECKFAFGAAKGSRKSPPGNNDRIMTFSGFRWIKVFGINAPKETKDSMLRYTASCILVCSAWHRNFIASRVESKFINARAFVFNGSSSARQMEKYEAALRRWVFRCIWDAMICVSRVRRSVRWHFENPNSKVLRDVWRDLWPPRVAGFNISGRAVTV